MSERNPDAPKRRVLIIEDDPTISQILVSKLGMCGFDVRNTVDSTLAVQVMNEFMPDIVILDLMMTRLSGEEIVKEIKTHEDLRSIPILVFSNKGVPNEETYGREMGADRFLVKANTSLDELVEVVGELIAKSKE